MNQPKGRRHPATRLPLTRRTSAVYRVEAGLIVDYPFSGAKDVSTSLRVSVEGPADVHSCG